MTFKLAMFDMDGVLLDSMPRHAETWCRRFREDCGFDMPLLEAYANEGRTSRSIISLMIRKYLGREASAEEIEQMYARKCAEVESLGPMPIMPGAIDAVRAVRAKGMEALVVTGSGHGQQLRLIGQAYPGLFRTDWMVSADDVSHCKPDPEPYLAGLKHANDWLASEGSLENSSANSFSRNSMGEPSEDFLSGGDVPFKNSAARIYPSEALVVENAPLGVMAGKAAGCFVAAVNTGPLPDSALWDAGADIVLPSMSALADWVMAL